MLIGPRMAEITEAQANGTFPSAREEEHLFLRWRGRWLPGGIHSL